MGTGGVLSILPVRDPRFHPSSHLVDGNSRQILQQMAVARRPGFVQTQKLTTCLSCLRQDDASCRKTSCISR